jgi:hypothetical protein
MRTKKPKGIGDVVKKITKAIGIEECEGCIKRKDWLNVNFPFGKPRPLTDNEKLNIDKTPLEIYNSAFNQDVNKDSFKGGVKIAILKKLNQLKQF